MQHPQRIAQILNQIVGILHPDAEANERIGQSDLEPFLARNARVRHRRGMPDQTFHAAQTFGEGEQMAVTQYLRRRLEGVVVEGETDHAPEVAHLTSGDFVVRMLGEAGPVDVFHQFLLAQPVSDLPRVFAGALHPQVERFDAPQCQKTVLRPGHRTDGVLQEVELFRQGFILHHHGTEDQIAMPAEILRRAVDDQIGTQIERILEVG